jgi:hypothetical protein
LLHLNWRSFIRLSFGRVVDSKKTMLHKFRQLAKIVLEVLRESKTVAELAAEHQIHPNLTSEAGVAKADRNTP